MFSKKNICWLLSFVLVATSCTPKVGEAPPETAQQKLGGTQCLSKLQPVVEAFIEGTAAAHDVEAAWDCASNAIVKFKKYVYGRTADRFEATELADFLKANFLDASSPDITPQMRIEAMRIKQLFLGGSIEYLTRTELDKIITMLGSLKEISLHLNPYMKLIAQKWSVGSSANVQDDIRYFEKASEEIQSAARSLANIIEENNQSYEMDHFITFLREFSDFTGQDWPIASDIEKGMPVIKKVKKAISGGDPDSIGPSEWKSFVLLGARGYLQYLRYFYFIKSASQTGSGIRLAYLARSLEDLLGGFQDLLEQKPVDASCGSAKQSCISKQEITEILVTFSEIWQEFQVSDKLIAEGMKIKKVIFGGTEDSLTSRDFERGKKKVASLKAIVEKFMPFYQVYGLEWDRSIYDYNSAQSFFKEAQNNLQSSAEDLGALFEDSYNVDNLTVLLTEIDRLYPNQEDPDRRVALEIQKFIPLAKDIKNIVFSENDTLIKKTQWSLFLKYCARFYNSFLFHNYFLKNEKYGSSQFLESFKRLTDQVLTVVRDVVLLKANQMISANELNQIAGRLIELEMIPKELTPQSIDQIVKVILNRILLPPELRLKGNKPNGITTVSLDNLRSEIDIWYETEKFLYSITMAPQKPTDLQSQIAKKLKDSKISSSLKAGLTEISLMVAGNVAQPIDADERLIISNNLKLTYNSQSVSRLNLNRTLGRTLIRASTTNLSRLQNYAGVNLAEAQDLFDQVRPAAVAMGLLKETNTSFMESRFRESNMFTAHSNGDEYANFPEMADIVGMILSGLTVNQLFRKDIEDGCLSNANKKADPSVSERCLRKVYADHTSTYMTATPDYIKFFKKLSADDATVFLQNMLKAAGHVPNNQNTVQLSDADLVPHVIQYIEMTMSKYDDDHDGVINLAESKNAFPSFKGILKELTKDQKLIKEKDLLPLFTYILYYGNPPEGVSDFLFKWLPWKGNESKWNIRADRKDLGGILGYIADQVAAAKQKNVKAVMISEEEAEKIRRLPEIYQGG